MKLHEDVGAFLTLLAIIGMRIGIREGIVKKD